MIKLQHKHAGLVLAAGASSRMGRPKSLLLLPDGTPLALHQARLLRAAGVDDVVIVLGSCAESIAPLLESADCRLLFHAGWESGRLSSLQAGLEAIDHATGVLVLPVDTVGVRSQTLQRVLEFADTSSALAVRPTWNKQSGRVLWLAHAFFNSILGLDASPEFRLDAWMQPHETRLPVDDACIVNNINTPDEWALVANRLI